MRHFFLKTKSSLCRYEYREMSCYTLSQTNLCGIRTTREDESPSGELTHNLSDSKPDFAIARQSMLTAQEAVCARYVSIGIFLHAAQGSNTQTAPLVARGRARVKRRALQCRRRVRPGQISVTLAGTTNMLLTYDAACSSINARSIEHRY